MLAKLTTFALQGIEAVPVEVEVDVSPAGLPKTLLVGLPEAAVRESTHRVERALVNSGFERPAHRVVINLAPADLPKDAASFDLPIALGILVGSGQVAAERLARYAVVGELALDGSTRPARGALSMAIAAARHEGLGGLLVPGASAGEAAVVEDVEVIAVASLAQAVGFLSGEIEIEPTPSRLGDLFRELASYDCDFGDVRGQEMAKRALTVAAAGGHNLLMVGPPGSGKTMLAKRVPTILPDLAPCESIETTRIYSALGRLKPGQPLLATRPFRAPHHTISNAGLVGGGSTPAPGEISLAHNGVLFLDELPEFNRQTLEVLRQPLEDGTVTIARALSSVTFPAEFMLIAAMNPCPCGYLGDARRRCNCTPPQIERYMSRISGPLVDRIDIHIEVPAVPFKDLSGAAPGTTSAAMREAVAAARERQAMRFERPVTRGGSRAFARESRTAAMLRPEVGEVPTGVGPPSAGIPHRDADATPDMKRSGHHAGGGTRRNSQMSHRLIREHCGLCDAGRELLRAAMSELGLSARAHDKVLRVARTIADLDGSDAIQPMHVSEAINYRLLDRQRWT